MQSRAYACKTRFCNNYITKPSFVKGQTKTTKYESTFVYAQPGCAIVRKQEQMFHGNTKGKSLLCQRSVYHQSGHDRQIHGSYLIISPVANHVIESLLFEGSDLFGLELEITQYDERAVEGQIFSAIEFDCENPELDFVRVFAECKVCSPEQIKVIKFDSHKDALAVCNLIPGWRESTYCASYQLTDTDDESA